MLKCVSTIRDECSGVGTEIGTVPKKAAVIITDDIVSADGDIGIKRAEHELLQILMTLPETGHLPEVILHL